MGKIDGTSEGSRLSLECDACTCIGLRIVLCLDGCQGSLVCMTIDVCTGMYNMKKDEIVPLFGAHARLHVFTNIARVDTRTNIIGRCTVSRISSGDALSDGECVCVFASPSLTDTTPRNTQKHTHTHTNTNTNTNYLSLSLSLSLSIYLSLKCTHKLSLSLSHSHSNAHTKDFIILRKAGVRPEPIEKLPNQLKSQSASRTN